MRFAEGSYDRLPAMAADLVGRKVEVIVAGGTPAAQAAKSATSTIPIVFTGVGDPVGTGLVASLARPGGNLTGISEMTTDLMSKRLELLSELVPQATVIALLVNPTNANATPYLGARAGSAPAAALQALIAANIDDYMGLRRHMTGDALRVAVAASAGAPMKLGILVSMRCSITFDRRVVAGKTPSPASVTRFRRDV